MESAAIPMAPFALGYTLCPAPRSGAGPKERLRVVWLTREMAVTIMAYVGAESAMNGASGLPTVADFRAVPVNDLPAAELGGLPVVAGSAPTDYVVRAIAGGGRALGILRSSPRPNHPGVQCETAFPPPTAAEVALRELAGMMRADNLSRTARVILAEAERGRRPALAH